MTEFKSCIQEVKQDIDGLGDRVNDMEQALEEWMEDLEVLLRPVATLEEQQLDSHLKYEDVKNSNRRNNTRIRGVPEGMEGTDIMSFVAKFLHTIHRDPDTSPPMPDRAHMVGIMTSHSTP
ncbi:hypothetical protein NDU88_002770 [Pleurodeles waltl]|uniref:Uncharacterized protein n=1 Tax=Pleurodeles waltl TaxID=8319 RepID=A0AAV7WR46_PLEWA|nr:hypothetical protein NDU88_002770 [Pleurodeles waltl]